jgi:hypothetical protein
MSELIGPRESRFRIYSNPDRRKPGGRTGRESIVTQRFDPRPSSVEVIRGPGPGSVYRNIVQHYAKRAGVQIEGLCTHALRAQSAQSEAPITTCVAANAAFRMSTHRTVASLRSTTAIQVLPLRGGATKPPPLQISTINNHQSPFK